MKRLLLLFSLLFLAAPAKATTTLSFVGSCTGTTSCTPPAHRAGDFFLVYVFRSNSTPVGLPATWTNISNATGSGSSSRVACKVAITSAETVTGFTNGTGLIALIYRGAQAGTPCNTVIIGTGATGTDNAGSSTLSYPGITMSNTNATSWVVGCGGSNTATNVGTAPTGMTNIVTAAGGTVACHDTAGPVSAWSTQTVGVNANAPWSTYVVEIRTCQNAACIVSGVQGVSNGSSTTIVTDAANHAANNKLVAVIKLGTSGRSVTGITNTASDTWALCSGSAQNSFQHSEIWETTGATNANATDITTVTINTNDTFKETNVYEVSGAAL